MFAIELLDKDSLLMLRAMRGRMEGSLRDLLWQSWKHHKLKISPQNDDLNLRHMEKMALLTVICPRTSCNLVAEKNLFVYIVLYKNRED